MKLSHLSLAIFAAISLAACGGSNNNSQVTPDNHGNGTVDQGNGTVDQGNGTVDQGNGTGNQGNGSGNQGNGSADQGNGTADQGNGTGNQGSGSADQGNGSNTDNTDNTNNGTDNNNSALDSDVKVEFADGIFDSQIENVANETINGEDFKIFKPVSGQPIETEANKVKYIQNPGLYDKDGNLPTTYADNGTVVDLAGQESGKVYYKAGDKFVKAYYAKGADDTAKFYKKDAKKAEADKKAPLADSDLFVAANNAWTNVKGFEVFGKTIARPEKEKTPADAIDRSGLKIGELTTSDIKATLEFKQLQQGLNSSKTNLGNATNADGKNTVISKTESVKIGSVMAYNLPHSLTTLSIDPNGDVAQTYFEDLNAVDTFGLKTASLPEDVKATYTGKVFTAKTKADLSLDVDFAKNNNGYVKNVKIENRTDADGKTLSAYVGDEPTIIGNKTFNVILVPVEKSITTAQAEYDQLLGTFYGSKAEEVAGKVLKSGSLEGAFAAQRGNLTDIK